MLVRRISIAALLVTSLTMGAGAQNPNPAVAAASKAMGVDALNSITYTGTARNGQFGQSKAIGEPQGAVNLTQITQYTRTINFAAAANPMALVSRATGPTTPPTVPGVPAPMPGVFNQNVSGMQLSANWGQALNVWATPWAFLKGAAANNATARAEGGQQVVSFSPAGLMSPSGQRYTITGYINAQNLVTKVETRVEHAVVGDLLREFEYSNYSNMNGVQVPGRIVEKQAGLQVFDATITAATANPANLAELLTAPPAPARGAGPGGAPAGAPPAGAPAGAPPAGGRAGAPPAGAPPAGGGGGGGGGGQAPAGPPVVERLGEGVFKIGGNYAAIAVDMGDHILVVESGQNDARGTAVMAAAKTAIPNKPIRFVVNSHPHFDHASGLAAAVAEGATILMGRNAEPTMERLLSGPRTLIGDSLSKVTTRRTNVVEPLGDRDVRRGTNGKVVEIHRVAASEHSDSHFIVFLPAEKVLYTADTPAAGMVNPNQLQVLRATLDATTRLNLQWDNMIPAHALMPDRIVPRAEIQALLTTAQQASN